MVAGPGDRDAARRRAVSDALLAAALAAGADVSGHTAVNRGIVTSDVAIVRSVGRILRHRILSETLSGATWRVRIEALVGEGPGPLCPVRTLIVTAYPATLAVDPHAPAWSGELARPSRSGWSSGWPSIRRPPSPAWPSGGPRASGAAARPSTTRASRRARCACPPTATASCPPSASAAWPARASSSRSS